MSDWFVLKGVNKKPEVYFTRFLVKVEYIEK